ncbi:galactosyl transferase GMA12/MNN10 domain protein [Paraburkholderia phenazinium]|uniref:galactosyl transferase GMA12/MNN10 domain protein n=1 Tax=Paraburkholderia phenazinium TaxID=60549 RepID=UPI00158DF8AA|nr:galactosyl transferase GMA12/MNN10 domain protein [Paraburkholderia phenazinium]
MIVLSHFCHEAAATLANHRYYAKQQGCRHEWIDAARMPGSLQLRCLYRYEVLLHTLQRAAPGELVLLLSEDSAIVDPVSLDNLMMNRDWLLVTTSSHPLVQVDVQVWRNTAAVRQIVSHILKRCKLGGERLTSEAALFAGLETHHYMTTINGVCPVMQAGYNFDPGWSRVPTFAISIDDAPDNPPCKGVSPRFRDVLVEHINRYRRSAAPIFSSRDHTVEDTAERSVYNPGCPIAVTTLYTPNIGAYARIAERNFRRYCELHGYTLYVHRAIPSEVGLNASGNWFKPWLLHAYMQHHEWVLWLDADVLVSDMQRKLEPLMAGREVLLAHDVGQWAFNSGVMGFRRTPGNDAMLRDLMNEVAGLMDRSSVYASDGDQMYFIRAMERAGLLDDNAVMDLVALNTPWNLRRPDSFIVHYYGMWTEMRAMMMAHDETHLS